MLREKFVKFYQKLIYGVTREEVELVNKAVEHEMKDIRSGKVKTYTLEEVEKRLSL